MRILITCGHTPDGLTHWIFEGRLCAVLARVRSALENQYCVVTVCGSSRRITLERPFMVFWVAAFAGQFDYESTVRFRPVFEEQLPFSHVDGVLRAFRNRAGYGGDSPACVDRDRVESPNQLAMNFAEKIHPSASSSVRAS